MSETTELVKFVPATKDSSKEYNRELALKAWKILKIVYDTNDNVLFGSRMTKGKVQYHYIPAEHMITGHPYITHVTIQYDGKGNIDLPEDSLLMPFDKLHEMFPDNVFV